MLKFWKKSGHADKTRKFQTATCTHSTNNHLPNAPTSSSNENGANVDDVGKCPLSGFDDEGLFDVGEFESTRERSRLSKTLDEVLCDKSALSYFIQFMESRNASPYVLCWLEIDSFKTELDLFKDNMKNHLKSVSPLPSSKADHDSLSVSTDCDSLTADTNSLNDYSAATISDCKVTISGCADDKTNSSIVCDRDTSDTSPKYRSDKSVTDNCDKKFTEFVDGALRLFKKFIAQESSCNVKCSEELRKEIMENLCNTENVLSGNCFDKVQSHVYNILERDYFEAFLGSDYFCKHQIDVLTSGNVVLDDILYNETALFYFMEFLEQENNRSLLEFWIAATNLQQQLEAQKNLFDPVEAQNDAVVLYDKYFSLQAHCPLGFSDKVRFAVEQNICGETGLVVDCFHLPLKIVEKVLEEKYFKSFLSSQLFYKYLSELINTVQTNGFGTNIERQTSPSDCGSERSFSTNSTFLAMEISHVKKPESKTNMSIDTRELYDPDSLWKRKHNHKLIGGRVTELGKYETNFEPEPDKKQFNLKKVVKKFVALDDEERKKEEMAWQVAEMIVKDITSVTLNDNKNLQL